MLNFLLIPFFIVGNRFCGGGFGWNQIARSNGGPIPGRPLYYFGLLAIGVLSYYYHLLGLIAALSFVAWRLPGWYGAIDAGTDKHTRLRDFLVMGLRAIPLALPFAYVVFTTGSFILPVLIGSLLVVSIPTAYDVSWHLIKNLKDPVAIAEKIAGACIGLAYSLLFVVLYAID